MKKIKLKSCPFCPSGEGQLTKEDISYVVKCTNCGAKGQPVTVKPWHTTIFTAQEEAAAAWNTRKPVEQILDQLNEKEDDYMSQYNRLKKNGFIEDALAAKANAYREVIEMIKAGEAID